MNGLQLKEGFLYFG